MIEQVRTIISVRHGLFPLNQRASLTGEAALKAVEEGIPDDAHETMGLLPEGVEQGLRVKEKLAGVAINVCLCSKTRRTHEMAAIILGGTTDTPILPEPGLKERHRGIFSYAPDEWAKAHPEYNIGKESTLHWRPKDGTSIAEEVYQLLPVLQRADQLAPGGTVLFSTHAEKMVALRALICNLDDDRLSKPLIPDPPIKVNGLLRTNWIENGQIDMFANVYPSTEHGPYMTHFRSIGTDPGFEFDTDWLEIKEFRK